MPQLGETVTEGTVAAWHKKIGDTVSQHDVLFDVETDKVATEVPAPADGVLAEILVPAGEVVKVGTRLAVIRTAADAVAVDTPVPVATPAEIARQTPVRKRAIVHEDARLSPVVRRLLAEHRIDSAQIQGSGRDGRITRDDVLAHIANPTDATAVAADPGEHAVRTVIPLNKIRQRTGAHMLRAWTTTPHVLQAVEVDFCIVENARRAHGAGWKAREGFSLTYLPFIARAVCDALKEFPQVNATIDGATLIVHDHVNLGIAVDLNFDGLIAPVIKDARAKSLTGLARAMHELIEKARQDRLEPDDLTQGTYTLSNSGSFGTLITAPIINPPQVAILSADGVRKKPVVIAGPKDDAIVIRPVGVLAQSFDHRAFDGAYSAAFLRRIKEILEQRDWPSDIS